MFRTYLLHDYVVWYMLFLMCFSSILFSLFLKSSRKYYYYRRPVVDISETHQRPTCLIEDPSETDMPDRRPISETDMPHQRPTCLIGDLHASLETDMPHRRRHAYSKTHQRPICLIEDLYASSETHKKYISYPGSVSDQACRSPMCLRSGMSTSDETCRSPNGSPIRHVSLEWVSDQACRSSMGLRLGMSVSDGSPIWSLIIIFS